MCIFLEFAGSELCYQCTLADRRLLKYIFQVFFFCLLYCFAIGLYWMQQFTWFGNSFKYILMNCGFDFDLYNGCKQNFLCNVKSMLTIAGVALPRFSSFQPSPFRGCHSESYTAFPLRSLSTTHLYSILVAFRANRLDQNRIAEALKIKAYSRCWKVFDFVLNCGFYFPVL